MGFPMLRLDLLTYQNRLKIQNEKGVAKVFDKFRKKYVVADPEELVRQMLLFYLTEEKGFPAGRISVEKIVRYSNKYNRYDLLIFDGNSRPQILIECKSPMVALTQISINQIMRYNTQLKCPYIILCNGTHVFMAQVDFVNSKYKPYFCIPNYGELEAVDN